MKLHLGTLAISSPAFAHGGRIPERFSRDGAAVSPPLAWTGVPAGTASFVLIAEDPDAPLTYGFTHWVLYGIPGGVTSLDEDAGSKYTSGVNSVGQAGYFPPGPPPGHGDHFYYFHLYALDALLDAEPGLDKATLLERIDDHIIEQARIVGIYSTPAR